MKEWSLDSANTARFFLKNKDELYKTNKDLYEKFFVYRTKADHESSFLEVKNIHGDDEAKFLYFFNKRVFQSLTISDSYILFPRLSMQYFPKFKNEESLLTKITINDSTVVFEEVQEHYSRIKKLEHLDLSYNSIEQLPQFIKKFDQLSTFTLRRNLLTNLPIQIGELNNLIEIDLSENKFKKIPEILFQIKNLEKLVMNSNMIDTMEYTKENDSLKYLFLANNNFKIIPLDIINFLEIKHIALESNKIMDINYNMFLDSKQRMKISLANNLIKNKEGIYPGFKGDILTVPPPNELANIKGVSKEDIDDMNKAANMDDKNMFINNNQSNSLMPSMSVMNTPNTGGGGGNLQQSNNIFKITANQMFTGTVGIGVGGGNKTEDLLLGGNGNGNPLNTNILDPEKKRIRREYIRRFNERQTTRTPRRL